METKENTNSTNSLLQLCFTPGLAGVVFFDFLPIEEVFCLKLVCKDALAMKKMFLGIRQQMFDRENLLLLIENDILSPMVDSVLLHKIEKHQIRNAKSIAKNIDKSNVCCYADFDWIYLRRSQFPRGIKHLSVFDCSNIYIDANGHPLESIVFKNSPPYHLLHNHSTVKCLRISEIDWDYRCFNYLERCTSLEELTLVILRGYVYSNEIVPYAIVDNLRNLSLTCHSQTRILLTNYQSLLKKLYIENSQSLVLSNELTQSLQEIHFKKVNYILFDAPFSNLVKLTLSTFNWKQIEHFIRHPFPNVRHIKFDIFDSKHPIQLDIGTRFPLAQTLVIHWRSKSAVQQPRYSLNIIGGSHLTDVYIHLETSICPTVTFSQMPIVRKLSCVFTPNYSGQYLSNPKRIVSAPLYRQFTIELDQINPHLKAEDMMFKVEDVHDFLNIKHTIPEFQKYVKQILEQDTAQKWSWVIEDLGKDVDEIKCLLNTLSNALQALIIQFFPKGINYETVSHFNELLNQKCTELCTELCNVRDSEFKGLNKHLSMLQNVENLMAEKYIILMTRSNQLLQTASPSNLLIMEKFMLQATAIKERFEHQWIEPKQYDTKNKIPSPLTEFFSKLRSCHEKCTEFLTRSNIEFVEPLQNQQQQVVQQQKRAKEETVQHQVYEQQQEQKQQEQKQQEQKQKQQEQKQQEQKQQEQKQQEQKQQEQKQQEQKQQEQKQQEQKQQEQKQQEQKQQEQKQQEQKQQEEYKEGQYEQYKQPHPKHQEYIRKKQKMKQERELFAKEVLLVRHISSLIQSFRVNEKSKLDLLFKEIEECCSLWSNIQLIPNVLLTSFHQKLKAHDEHTRQLEVSIFQLECTIQALENHLLLNIPPFPSIS